MNDREPLARESHKNGGTVEDPITQLQETRDFLMEHGWHKGDLWDEVTKRWCLLGALWTQADKRVGYGPAPCGFAVHYLLSALPEKYLVDPPAESKKHPVARFNDDPETTFNDVIQLLDDALLIAKERHAAE